MEHKIMKRMAFISRHEPTEKQIELAENLGFKLVHVGDFDAFDVSPEEIDKIGCFHAVAVVHPAAAMNLYKSYKIAVFKNANRAPVGQPPQFEADSLHFWG